MDRNHWGAGGAGFAFVCQEDQTLLLALRSHLVNEPCTWALPGGRVEPGEHTLDAAVRETVEELGSSPAGVIVHTHTYKDGWFRYVTYVIAVTAEEKARWTPLIELNEESEHAAWFRAGELPAPLHFGVEAMREVLLTCAAG